MNSCQAPTWTSVRLQPPKHQLCFAKTPILDFRSTNSQGLQSCSVLRLQPNLDINWFCYFCLCCFCYLYSLCCFYCLCTLRWFCCLFSGFSPQQQHYSPLCFLFLYIPCLCPFVSSYMLALWLPIPLLLLSIQMFQYSQDVLYQWQALSQRRGLYS